MREIKFRAWDEQEERVIYMDAVDYGQDEYVWQVDLEAIKCQRVEWYQNTLGGEVNDTYEVNRDDILPLMQYTGLKDKNGVEIYEGDIMALSDLKQSCYVVKYQENRFVLDGISLFDNSHYFTERKVIGNIYENPELLGKL